MPLGEAASAVQTAWHGSDLDRMARGLGETDEDVLLFWASRMARDGVPIYGRRIMSTRDELIPRDELVAGRLVQHATRLDARRGEPLQDVCDLRVKRADLAQHLARRSRPQ